MTDTPRGPTTEQLRARVLAQTLCGCRARCGDDSDTEGPGVCKGLPRMPEPPLVEVVLVPRDRAALLLPRPCLACNREQGERMCDLCQRLEVAEAGAE